MRRAAVVGTVLGVALVVPATASAHALLTSASPATQSRVERAPTSVVLRFNTPVTATSRSIEVFDESGDLVSGAPVVGADGRVVTAPVHGLERGFWYTVRWRVVGQDGHSPTGVYTFGLGVTPPAPTLAAGARPASWRDDVARWLLFAALSLLIGPLLVRLVVLRGKVPRALEWRFHLVPTIAAFAVIDLGIAAFVVRASNALQLPFWELLYGDLQPFAEKTRFGLAFLVLTVGFAVVAALLVLAWVFDLPRLRWPALALSLLLAFGFSLSGHQGTEPNAARLSELADWLHLVAACIWVGGVATLAFIVWPAAPGLRARAFLGFARLAVVLVAAMVLAGAYLALVRLSAPSDLWETGYGQVLSVKGALVVVALAWGAIHHFVVRPRLEAGATPRVRSSLVGETAVALAVLLAAAVLANVAPPPGGQSSTTSVRAGR